MGHDALRGFVAAQKVDVGLLHFEIKLGLIGEAVQKICHPPRESLGLPDAGEGLLAVGLQSCAIVLKVVLFEALKEIVNIACGSVEPLGARGWDDMGRITTEKEAAPAHWLSHKAAQGRDGLFDAWSCDKLFGVLGWYAALQLLPEGFVCPVFGFVRERALDIIAAELGVAHGAEGKTALGGGINQFVVDGGCL